jgi:hypothetical protein
MAWVSPQHRICPSPRSAQVTFAPASIDTTKGLGIGVAVNVGENVGVIVDDGEGVRVEGRVRVNVDAFLVAVEVSLIGLQPASATEKRINMRSDFPLSIFPP